MSSTTLECQRFLTPNAETPYSHQYFQSLTFEDTLALKNAYPVSLPTGSLLEWRFDRAVHNSSQAVTVQPFELLPHYDDVRGIIDQMPSAYAESNRSVRLALSIPGSHCPRVVFYHLLKVCFLTS